MKSLLIRPPARFIEGAIKPAISLPTGLLYLASVLEQAGRTVGIYDAQLNNNRPVIRDADGTLHMGDSWDAVQAKIRAYRPDLVGISCMFSAQMENALRLAEIVKQIDPGIVTIIGGSHPTVRPADFFEKTSAIDLVCLGEGEFTLRDVVQKLAAKEALSDVPGIAVREKGTLKINPARPRISPLDEIPLPAYHLINLEDYFNLYAQGYTDRPIPRSSGFERSVSIITSRGCPHLCVFCSVHLHMGRAWRAHSVDYVKRHLDLLTGTYGVRHIHFEDDNVSLDARRFQGILKLIQDARPALSWDTPNGLRVDTLTRDMLQLCRDSGCVYIIFGVESGNQQVLDKIVNKRLDLASVLRAAAWAQEIGIDAMAFFVIGFPKETKSQMQDTADFAVGLQARYDVTPFLFVATPLPGTKLEQICIEEGYIPHALSPQELARMTQGAMYIGTDTFSAADIEEVKKSFLKRYRINVIRRGMAIMVRRPLGFIRILRHMNAFRKTLPLAESVATTLRLGNWIVKKRQERS
jgi:anaerobic magnesium-protoporphyrin IX monomethyl ester cyclase